MVRRKNTIADFWSKVDKTGANGCWNWTASCNRQGYGKFTIDSKTVNAHRFSLEIALGRPIADGLCALHRCKQNRKCVNPEHLYEGTQQENIDDMVRDGTFATGEAQGLSKLNDDSVREIRILKGFGFTHRELGKMYGVAKSVIGGVLRGETWKHI